MKAFEGAHEGCFALLRGGGDPPGPLSGGMITENSARRRHDVGLGLSAQRVDVSAIAQDLGRVPDDEPAEVVGLTTARVYNFVAWLTAPA